MNIRFSALFAALVCLAPSFTHPFAPQHTDKQKCILFLKSINGKCWASTAPHRQPDPLFKLHPTLNSLPGLPAAAGLFFQRTSHAVDIQEFVNTEAFQDTFLYPFSNLTPKIQIQEHTAGLHLGQIWSQDNLDVSWQWWVGVKERNWWLSSDDRAQFLKTLSQLNTQSTRSTLQDNYAPQEQYRRLTPWHATNAHVGLGDVHLQMRYRLALTNNISLSLGLYSTVPVGTQESRKTPVTGEDTPPLDSGDELSMRLINRAREIMLATTFGSGGHLGIGGQTLAQINLSDSWSLQGQWLHVYYRGGIENRFTLNPAQPTTPLEEGALGTAENISPNEVIWQHMKHSIYPCETKIHIQPGALQTGGLSLHYSRNPFHASLAYWIEKQGPEYSELAPLATITRHSIENERVHLTCGWRKRHEWGEASTYFSGHYATRGTQKGAWGLCIGATVQA